jgi:hypothetical protein
MPIGSRVPIEPIVFGDSDAKPIPEGVTNWTFFEGAVMALWLSDGVTTESVGTAVMVAPGLAITATHTFRARLAEIQAAEIGLLCAAPTSAGLDLWRPRELSFDDLGDIAYMSVERASPIGDDWRLRVLPLTTRCPAVGERLHIIGLRLDKSVDDGTSVALAGDLYAAAGAVVAVYPSGRDQLLVPYPAIDLACGSLGGMSGGAVIDNRGFLMGVISRGWSTDDGLGPTTAAWLVGALDRTLKIPWPPGLYGPSVRLLDVHEQLLRIEGRDHIHRIDDDRYDYEVWHRP